MNFSEKIKFAFDKHALSVQERFKGEFSIQSFVVAQAVAISVGVYAGLQLAPLLTDDFLQKAYIVAGAGAIGSKLILKLDEWITRDAAYSSSADEPAFSRHINNISNERLLRRLTDLSGPFPLQEKLFAALIKEVADSGSDERLKRFSDYLFEKVPDEKLVARINQELDKQKFRAVGEAFDRLGKYKVLMSTKDYKVNGVNELYGRLEKSLTQNNIGIDFNKANTDAFVSESSKLGTQIKPNSRNAIQQENLNTSFVKTQFFSEADLEQTISRIGKMAEPVIFERISETVIEQANKIETRAKRIEPTLDLSDSVEMSKLKH